MTNQIQDQSLINNIKMNVVKLDPKVLQFRDDRHLPRPKAVPFNKVDQGKIAYAGTADNLLMIVFYGKNDKNGNKVVSNQISWFRNVPKSLIDSVTKGEPLACSQFTQEALDGLFDCYVEDNLTPYFL